MGYPKCTIVSKCYIYFIWHSMDQLSQEVAIITYSSFFILLIIIGIIILVMVYQKKQLHFLQEREHLKVVYEKQLLETQLEIQEQTLKTISQEIHDNIGQVLSLAKLNLNSIPPAETLAVATKIDDTKKLNIIGALIYRNAK